MSKVNIGKIVNTHGVKGEIRILSDFDMKDKAFKPGNKVIINDGEFTINSYRVHKNFDMITLKEFNNINEVLPFKGKTIFINRDELELSKNDYILDDLLDMNVFIEDDLIGVVSDYSNDKNPLLKIRGNKIFYIPIKANYIKKVDLDNNALYVTEDTRGLIL